MSYSYNSVWSTAALFPLRNRPSAYSSYDDDMIFFRILKTVWISTFGFGVVAGGFTGFWDGILKR